MSDDASPRRRTSRRMLLAIARVGALIILATGTNGALAAALPQLDPLVRNGIALALTVFVDALLRRSKPRPEVVQAAPTASDSDNELLTGELAEGRAWIDRLQADLIASAAELERLRGDGEARAAAQARDTEELKRVNVSLRQQMTTQQTTASEQAAKQNGLIAELKGEAAKNSALISDLKSDAAKHNGLIAELKGEAAKSRSSAEEEARQRRVDGENARAREARLHEQFQAETKHLEHAASSALEDVQRTRAVNAELRAELDRERAERKQLETQRVDFDGRLAVALEEIDALRTERERARRELDEMRQRGEAEKTALRGALDSQSGVKQQKLIAEHQAEIGKAAAALEAARAEVRTLQQRIDSSQKTSEEILRGNDELARQLEEERQRFHGELEQQKAALQSQLDAQWSAKLQKIATELAGDHENDLGDAITAREAARAEVRSLNSRIKELQQQVEIVRDGRLALLQRDDGLTHQLEAERQRARELEDTRARLEQEIVTLREGGPRFDEKALRDTIDLEWSGKLQKIVTELTSDHENDIGDSIAAREAARAEARALNIRVLELQQQLQAARDGRFGLLQRDDEVTQQFEAERRMTRELSETCERLEEENTTLKEQLQSRQSIDKSLRDQIDAEWSAKLQTVVNHLASDHEAEIGKAIEEREAARAEARNLVGKVSTLQQRIDAERQAVAAGEEKLRRSQDEIIALRSTPAAPEPVLQPPPPLPEINEERARADVLEFAEQANQVLRRVSSPGNVPIPVVERKTRVLFVHHDPASRSMWRDNLEKNGFDVVIAADGLEGLRLAMAHKPDVVVADASMPKMDGRELCQLIKSNQETANVKVILMTGVYTNEAPIDAREFEADEMLRKPVKFDVLKAALTGLLAAKV